MRPFSQAVDAPDEIALDFEESTERVSIVRIRDLFNAEIAYFRELKRTGKSPL